MKKKKLEDRLFMIITVLIPLLLTAWLFFDFAVCSFLLFLYVPVALKKKNKEMRKKQKWELNLAFQDALVCLENSLAVGYSPESSVKESIKSLEQLYGKEHSICQEFRKMVQQMELGMTLEDTFLGFAGRHGIEDIQQLADILAIVKRTGGNLGQVLRQTGSVLREKIELKRELRTVIAAKQMEFQIMSVVPYGILLYLKLCASSMSVGLYHNWFGILFMWVVFGAYMGFRALGNRIIYKEIGKLEGNS